VDKPWTAPGVIKWVTIEIGLMAGIAGSQEQGQQFCLIIKTGHI